MQTPIFPAHSPVTIKPAQLIEALCYKPEGRGFDSRLCHCNFSSTQSFRPRCGPGDDSASNRNEYQDKRRPVRRADNLTTFICRLSWNLGASTSWNPLGLFRPVMELLYLFTTALICGLGSNKIPDRYKSPAVSLLEKAYLKSLKGERENFCKRYMWSFYGRNSWTLWCGWTLKADAAAT